MKPVEYYENNMEETKAVLKKCEVTQGSQNDQNCLNAKNASRNKYIAEQFKLPSWAKMYEE